MKIYNELEGLGFFQWLSETHNLADTYIDSEYLDGLPLKDIHRTVVNAIAFRWFREKYGVCMHPEKFDVDKWWVEWGQERMYSEEDLISFAHFYFREEFNSTMQNSNKSTDEILQEWFNQFKNKNNE